jgi:DNA-directed RNA polymerase specialized sigma24 family protein
MPTLELQTFFAGLRSGDAALAKEAIDRVSPILSQIIHLRLIDGRLRHILDTDDILQSLLKDFLSRRRAPDEASVGLQAYLAGAVLNKVVTKMRKERRHVGGLPDACEPTSSEPPLGSRQELRDSLQWLRSRLPEEHRELFDLKARGLTWPEIANQLGSEPDALRIRLRRALAAAVGQDERKELDHVG